MAQATTDAPTEHVYRFEAGSIAAAWLGVAQASGKDEERPALSRTMLVEFHDDGVRLCATDGYVLLTSWVPMAFLGEPPAIDEAPVDSVVAIDPYGRGKGLMGHLRKLAAEAEESGHEVQLDFRVGQLASSPEETVQFDGLEQRALILEHPGSEELALPLFEGDYPAWRGILGTHAAEATAAIALSPEVLARVSQLGKLYSEPLVWRFGGPEGAALISIGPIYGAAMPMRWPGIDSAKVEKDDG